MSLGLLHAFMGIKCHGSERQGITWKHIPWAHIPWSSNISVGIPLMPLDT